MDSYKLAQEQPYQDVNGRSPRTADHRALLEYGIGWTKESDEKDKPMAIFTQPPFLKNRFDVSLN